MNRKLLSKLLPPVIVAALLLIYGAVYLGICFWLPIPLGLKHLGGGIGAALAGVLIFVTIERINEIRSGEDDDLGNY